VVTFGVIFCALIYFFHVIIIFLSFFFFLPLRQQFFVMGFFKTESCELFAEAGFEL
jgi:hypothetical protein